jgi:hypothetical protein
MDDGGVEAKYHNLFIYKGLFTALFVGAIGPLPAITLATKVFEMPRGRRAPKLGPVS